MAAAGNTQGAEYQGAPLVFVALAATAAGAAGFSAIVAPVSVL